MQDNLDQVLIMSFKPDGQILNTFKDVGNSVTNYKHIRKTFT